VSELARAYIAIGEPAVVLVVDGVAAKLAISA
jgi:hypothetical protein